MSSSCPVPQNLTFQSVRIDSVVAHGLHVLDSPHFGPVRPDGRIRMVAARFRVAVVGTIALALWASAPAEAVRIGPDSILECPDPGADCVTDFSSANLLEFDADLISGDPVLLDITLDPEDDQPEIAFSAFLINSSPIDWSMFRIVLLGGPTFASVGDLVPETSVAVVSLSGDLRTALISFDPLEFAGFALGNPLEPIDSLDWFLDLNGLGPGDSFQMRLDFTDTAFVPEPGVAFLLGFGLAALVSLRIRRGSRR